MQFVRKYIVLTFFSFCFNSFIEAQILGTKTFSINDDASTRILSLIKHSKGFLIAGTNNGIFRFNGNTFSPYHFNDSIKTRAITSICEIGFSDTIWVGFQTGEIGFIKNGKVELIQAEEGHPKVAITSVLQDQKGVVFFATAGEGLYYYLNKRFYNINTDDGLSDNYVYDIRLSLSNNIIAGTDHGVNICTVEGAKKKVSFYASANGIPDNIVRSLEPAADNRFFIGMQDKGVGVFDVGSSAFSPLDNITDWIYEQVNSIIKTVAEVWIGTESKGLIKATSKNIAPATFSNDLTFNKVNHLTEDNEGNIWFTSNNQLVKTSGAQLQNIIPFNNDLYSQVHTILSDSDSSIWVNDNNGLLHYTLRGDRWQVTKHILPSINEAVDITSLYQDKYRNIWVGTMGKGVIVLDPRSNKTRSITEDAILIGGSILSINGRDNQIWISSLSGAIQCRLADKNKDIKEQYEFTNYSSLSGIGSNYVYSIMPDSKNRVWFATDGKGVTMYENGNFVNFNEKNGLRSTVIYSLCEDDDKNIWFSTLNAGIYRFDGVNFTNISVEKGLNDATVTALSTDRKGNIIAVTKKGVNIIDRKTFSISYIDADEGINDWNADLNCIAKTPAGDLLFSTASGIVRFSPSYTWLQPQIVLESVQLFLKDLDFEKQVKFSYDENNFSFAFSGISLSHPTKVQYQYRLEGLGNEWVPTRDNKINFPKLPPGNYTFRVRASLNNNFANSNEASYKFSISKPFWIKWWFIISVVLVFISLLYWYIKNREKRLQRWGKLEKERIQSQFETLKSQVNPHFLFNSFNTLISVIEESPDKAVEYVEHLSDLYRKIVTYRDKDLITLAEEVELIKDYYFIQQKRFGCNLQLKVEVSKEDLQQYLIAPLTLQLLSENAVKHNSISAETPLSISIGKNDQWLIVKNNLNPKMTIEKGAGMGLPNIQNRYKLLNTDPVKIEKTATEFVVHIPLIKA